MANNYLQFAAGYTAPKAEIDEIVRRLQALEDWDGETEDEDGSALPLPRLFAEDSEDDLDVMPCEWHRDGDGGVLFSADESGDLLRVSSLIAEVQRQFVSDRAFTAQFAETCSKPRIDEFGGGAVVVYRGEQRWTDTSTWVRQTCDELGITGEQRYGDRTGVALCGCTCAYCPGTTLDATHACPNPEHETNVRLCYTCARCLGPLANLSKAVYDGEARWPNGKIKMRHYPACPIKEE